MALNLTVSLAGDVQLSRRLGIMASKVSDLRPAFYAIGNMLREYQGNMFRSGGGHDGFSKWTPLAQSTIKRKGNDRVLIDTGKLLRAFTSLDSAGAVREYKPKSMLWGVDENEIPYAGYHQHGARRGSKRTQPNWSLPRRPPLRLSNKMRRNIVKMIQAHIVKTDQFQRETLFTGN